MSVVFFHYLANGIRSDKISSFERFGALSDIAEYGYLGVDFFFLVSGFVIMFSAANTTPERFVVSRFVRLWPTFLLCMSLTAILRLTWGGPVMAITWQQYLVNVTMIAPYLGFDNIDRVYWSLTYEIFFYATVFLVLLADRIRHAEMLVQVWITAIIVTMIADIDLPMFRPFFILFAAGCMFSFVQNGGMTARRVASLLVCLAVAIYAAQDRAANLSIMREYDLSPFVIAAVTAAFFAIFLVFTTSRLRSVGLPFARHFGLMTYPLYLLHAYIGYIVLSRYGSEANKEWLVAVTVVGMLAASLAVVTLWEQPFRQAWIAMADWLLGTPIRQLLRITRRSARTA